MFSDLFYLAQIVVASFYGELFHFPFLENVSLAIKDRTNSWNSSKKLK